jgi:hypothetical protein
MTIEQLRAWCETVPFRPFTIHLADGRAIPVRHREFIMPSPSGRTVSVYLPDDTLHVIDLLLVTDLEAAPKDNGSRRRRQA